MTKEEIELQEKKDKETMDNIVEAVTEQVTPKTVEAVIAKLKAEQPLRKNIFEDGSDNERKELAEQKKGAADFLKAMEKGDRAAVKALSAGGSTSGAELVPTYVS